MGFQLNQHPRIRFLALLIGILLGLQASPAASRIYIDIHSPLYKKIPIAIPEFRHEGSDAADHPLGNKLAEMLGGSLSFTGIFQVLNPAMFLEDPQQMGTTLPEIKFPEWSFLGADLLVRGSYRVEGGRLLVVVRLFDVINRSRVLTQTYESDREAARQIMLRFAEEMMMYLTGDPGVFRTRIAFVGDATSHKEIYLADFDGTNVRRLTHDNSICLTPDWSADGKMISYVSYRRGNPDLYTLNLMNRAVESISKRPGLNIAPAWHPKGGKLAATLSISGNPELYILDAGGQMLEQLTSSWAISVSPSWSPDGRKLAYVSNRADKPQIYVLDLATGRSNRLTFEGYYNTSPAWSPRGDRIVYAGLHNGRFDLFLINPDGRDLRQLTGGTGNNENPCWSPDGRMILFQSDRQGTPTLWVMLANGSDQRRLRVNLGGGHTEPAWSPRLTWTTP